MIKEFKEFINKGNLVEMAVAFVLGTAFAALVKSFTDDILMQAVAVVFGTPDFSELTVTLNDATIRYGAFINAAITFLILAVTMFAVVKGYNALRRSSDDVDAGPDELELLTEIRDALRDRR